MFFELNFKESIDVIYHAPFSLIIFYYLILYCSVRSISAILQASFSLPKFNGVGFEEKIIPALTIFGWFGFVYEFVFVFLFSEDKATSILFSILVLISLLYFSEKLMFLLQKILFRPERPKGTHEIKIGGNGYYARHHLSGATAEKKINYYVEQTSTIYRNLFLKSLLILFCIIYAYKGFEFESFILVVALTIIYFKLDLYESTKRLFLDARGNFQIKNNLIDVNSILDESAEEKSWQ